MIFNPYFRKACVLLVHVQSQYYEAPVAKPALWPLSGARLLRAFIAISSRKKRYLLILQD